MSTYCVTFRIADKSVNGKTYADRREALIDNVYADNDGYWEETTSFFFVGSSLDTYSFAKKAVKGLSPNDDLVVLFDPSDMSAAYFGPVEHLDVLKFFLPGIKKVP
ncbi:MAG TPA: hypothetical protein VHG92_11420 [Afifellaceae bacterium]|nr:hypothetical protein [Afifellaceae bacterium]